ncbi:MAG TPA: DUF2520 domain-containing protein [Parafilimonas sp.]|nr:DUF2520 domain-containing protein [Parafilimonas sp.]
MNITIIGSGNVAVALGKLFKENNHAVNEVVGRNAITVRNLAETLGTGFCFSLDQMNTNSDMFVIAVKDDAVAEVSAQLNLHEKIVVHTCGSVSIKALEQTSKNYGALYPLQSLRKELNYSPVIPLLVDGNNDSTRQTIFNLASSVSDSVIIANDEMRLQYHLSAIIVSNFSNHLFALAKEYCDKNNTDFKLLLPLIEETVHRMHYYDPADMQTGPAARGDEITLQKHLVLLQSLPELQKIYELMSESIKHRRQ